ncbi:FadR family transcriptional regulator [Novosphingobium sp. ERN07]|uniref:GntR family transcriptional regulator n=1 Tax=Novosphingobium sp. ERN07 TaxID=2726187 RepID=UPI0014578FD2|nr:FadR family transcriptional regulator [Novosphingobium sp. ERN07]
MDHSDIRKPPVRSAEALADRIANTVLKRELSLGASIGSEHGLAEELGCSPALVREAVLILEREGLVERRRGRAGGLFISATPLDAAATALSNFMFFARLSIADVFSIRPQLEAIAFRLAAARARARDVDPLRAACRAVTQQAKYGILPPMAELYERILDTARSPILGMLVNALMKVSVVGYLQTHDPSKGMDSMFSELVALRVRQVEAILSEDISALAILHDLSDKFTQRVMSDAVMAAPVAISQDTDRLTLALQYGPAKIRAADVLAWRIHSEINAKAMEPGELLGTEADLVRRFGVSRSVFRATISYLARLRLVVVQRGRNSGIWVGEFDQTQIVDSVARYLHHAHPHDDEIIEALVPLEARMLETALAAGQANGMRAEWETMCLAETPFSTAVAQFYEPLRQACGSPIMSVFHRCLVRSLTLAGDVEQSDGDLSINKWRREMAAAVPDVRRMLMANAGLLSTILGRRRDTAQRERTR